MNRIQLTDLVLTDGCFDPLHVGHIAYLEAASRLARRLVVHIASDEAIRAKGRESFQTRPERARTVGMLKCVGDTFEHQTLADAIRGLRPNVLAKGRDWIGKLPEDVVAACREVGTVIVYTDTQERTSTERLSVAERLNVIALKQTDAKFYPDAAVNHARYIPDTKFYRPGYYRGDPGDENDEHRCFNHPCTICGRPTAVPK